MILTAHWSVSPPQAIGDYHFEFWRTSYPYSTAMQAACAAYVHGFDWAAAVAEHGAAEAIKLGPSVDLGELRAMFANVKNFSFSQPTTYGTWELNNDPRDDSTDIEVAACCMGGEGVSVAGPWGANPYTFAHFIFHAEALGRIAKIKGINPLETFDVSVEPSILQNGPIPVLSTHGERAIQTQDPGPNGAKTPELSARFGYFAYSGDPDCRWDVAAPDPSLAGFLGTPDSARAYCLQTAAKLRAMTAVSIARGYTDYWNLD